MTLRERRKAAGLSQRALAERAGLSLSMIRLLENGYRPQQSVAAEKVEAALSAAEPADA